MVSNKRMIQPNVLSLIGVLACTTVAIAGCQSTIKPSTTQAAKASSMSHSVALGKSSLSCAGVYGCEINAIGKSAVISQLTHKPSPTLTQNSRVAIAPLTTTNQQGHASFPSYLVTFPSGQQLVETHFYLDDSLNIVENFSFMHNFESGKHYQLKAYRQIQKTDYSLLAQSTPTPLCIDLYENDKLANKWCKKPNQTGALSNEFIKVPF